MTDENPFPLGHPFAFLPDLFAAVAVTLLRYQRMQWTGRRGPWRGTS